MSNKCNACGIKVDIVDPQGNCINCSIQILVKRAEHSEAVVKELAKVAGWSDTSVTHALLHVSNLINNLRADVAVTEKERDVLKVQVAELKDQAKDDSHPFIIGTLDAQAQRIAELKRDVADAEAATDTLHGVSEDRIWSLIRERDTLKVQLAETMSLLEDKEPIADVEKRLRSIVNMRAENKALKAHITPL